MRSALVLAAALALASVAAAPPSGNGSGSGKLGKKIEVTVEDGSIAPFPFFVPVAGEETVRHSVTDYLRFANGKSNVRALWEYSAALTLVRDDDGTSTSTTVSYQGSTTTLADLALLAQSASGPFTPWEVRTATDLTSEGATGWTNPSGCGTMTYQGTFSILSYSAAGAPQAATTRYYRVCDTATELYVGASRDLSAADYALLSTETSAAASASDANYEVGILGNLYVFYAAPSAASVTIRQGDLVPLSDSSSESRDLYVLLRFPDGFPAGDVSGTITATTSGVIT